MGVCYQTLEKSIVSQEARQPLFENGYLRKAPASLLGGLLLTTPPSFHQGGERKGWTLEAGSCYPQCYLVASVSILIGFTSHQMLQVGVWKELGKCVCVFVGEDGSRLPSE